MPVEIRELIIKATVVQGTSSGTQASTTSANELTSAEEIINECIEKMIEIEKNKKER
ncbi:MAG TPA: DUF5908 family protein [Puia sp.]|nr:DUF5908 family protein [Puia sp.]